MKSARSLKNRTFQSAGIIIKRNGIAAIAAETAVASRAVAAAETLLRRRRFPGVYPPQGVAIPRASRQQSLQSRWQSALAPVCNSADRLQLLN